MTKTKAFLNKMYKGVTVQIWILLLFFLTLRITYVILLGGFDKSEFSDAYGYNQYALTILKSKSWLTNNDFLASWREPLYPMFVALIYLFGGSENFLAVYIVQAFIGTITILIIYKLSLLSFDSKRAALLSLIFSGFYIGYLRYTGELLRETLIVFFVVYFFYQISKLIKPRKLNLKAIILLSLIYTCLIHTDGRYLFYAPFLFLFFILKIIDFKKSLVQFLIFGAFTVLLTMPWAIRNYITYGNVYIVSKYTLNLSGKGLSERSDLFYFGKIDSVYTTLHYTHNMNFPSEAERNLIKQGLITNNRTEQEIKAILNDIYPAKTFLGRKWYYIKAMWKPYDFSYNYAPFPQAFFEGPWSLKHNLLSIFSYGILLPFLLIGVFISMRERNYRIYFLILPVFIHFILHTLTFGIERYRYPVDAFIIIIGCFGITYALDKVRKQINS